MTLVVAALRKTGKLWMLAIAVMVVAGVVAQSDGASASTAKTRIFLSTSATVQNEVTQILLVEGGPAQTYYIWAENIKEPLGLGTFQVTAVYVSFLVSVDAIVDDDTYLISTGRNSFCINPPIIDPKLGLGHATILCNTIGFSPPNGPQGDGLLGSITVSPGITFAATTLDFTQSLLVDTGWIDGSTPISPAEIPANMPIVPLVVSPCADFNGDGQVDLFNDIFGVALRFGWTTAHPEWDSVYDLNEDGTIDLFNDIFVTSFQFGFTCPV